MNEKVYNKQGKELITLTEAKKLGYGNTSTFRMQILAGTLKAIKKGKTLLVLKEDVRKQSKN